MTRDRSLTAALLTVAVGVWVLGDFVRVWAPSLITIFGQAASTPPELMGAYALGCVLVGVSVAFLGRRHPMGAGWIALAATIVGRVALQLTDGGQPQLFVASIGIATGIAWLSLAAVSLGDVLVVGVAVGTTLGVVTHAALGTWGAVWREDAWAAGLLLAQVGGAAAGWWFARGRHPSASAARAAWLVMPGLLLAGVVLGNAGRASAIGGEVGLVVVALASVGAVLTAAMRPTRGTAWTAAVVLACAMSTGLLVITEVTGIPGVAPPWTVAAFAVGLPALTHLWAAADHGRPARATTLGLGALVWVVLLFVYYAGYDLGYRADLVLVLAAVVVGVVAASTPAVPSGDVRVRLSPRLLGGFAVAAAVLAWLGPPVTISPIDGGGDGNGLRVTAYNVRMGYGMDGTFRPDLVAETLKDQDVVLLSEVDRAWHLNGGQDQLAILTRLLERPSVFGPAADQVWGDAVLTSLPVVKFVGTPLPSHGAATGAQALSVLIDIAGTPTWFVSTHLQPMDAKEGVDAQTGDLVRMLRTRLADGHPLVLGGDLNTRPGSDALRQLTDLGLVDALAGAGPTSPADRPRARIDHLFVTPDLTPMSPGVGTSQASDHLPVHVTLAVRP